MKLTKSPPRNESNVEKLDRARSKFGSHGGRVQEKESNHARKGSITDWKLFQYIVKRIGHDRKHD